MISRALRLTSCGLLLAGAIVVFVGYRLSNAKLRQRIIDLRQQNTEALRLREESQRAKEQVALFATDAASAEQAMQRDVVQLRKEVAALEQRAVQRRAEHQAQTVADAAALEANRDSRKGPIRAEFAVNAGRATPGAAFETLIWAAPKGQDETMAAAVAVTGRAREKAEALLADLPAEARIKYPTPEKLAALFFANGILQELQSFEVLDHTLIDATHAKLAVRFPGGARRRAS